MRKTILRLLALILTFAMALSLAACAQDAPDQNNQETQPKNEKPTETELTQGDPIVRLYFPAEEFGNTSSGQYEYEENWWEKDEFVRTVYAIDEHGNETVRKQYLNTNGEIRTDAYDEFGTTVIRYEDGMRVCTYSESTENALGQLSTTTTYEYDCFGRIVTETTETEFVEPEENGKITTVYEYTETDFGSVAVIEVAGVRIELVYDENNRLVQKTTYSGDEMFNRYDYEYNSAGSQTKLEWSTKNGDTIWSKTVYDYIEVPLSVAQKWPMFKWEYID